MEKVAFVADTPLQVLNCIRLRTSLYAPTEVCDIFVGLQFPNAESVAQNLKKYGVFDRVISYLPELTGDVGLAKRIIYIASPIRRIKSMLLHDVDLSSISAYSAVFMSLYNRFSTPLRFINSQAKTVFYDDGIGSYNDTVFAQLRSRKLRFGYGIFGRSFASIAPVAVYLNAPEFAHYEGFSPDVRKLSSVENDKECNLVIQRIFEIGELPAIQQHAVTYLTQPLEGEMLSNAVKKTTATVIATGVDALVRRHPREPQEKLHNLPLDNSGALWEVAAESCVDDSSVLMSVFSTALFVPKLMYAKEPTLIFTYRLSYSGDTASQMNDLVGRLRSVYKCPEKILTPENQEELADVLTMVGKYRAGKPTCVHGNGRL